MVRASQRCGSEFEFEYTGSRSATCLLFRMQPEGTRMVKSANTSHEKVSADAA
jgi:hypothetical protein